MVQEVARKPVGPSLQDKALRLKSKRALPDEALGIVSTSDLRIASAQRFYRVLIPFRGLTNLGCHTYISEASRDADVQLPMILASDILLQWSGASEAHVETAKLWKALKPIHKNGEMLTPPIMVMDMDDALEFIHPFNGTFACYGIRDWDGRFLEPGDTVYWGKKPMWVDKQTRGDQFIQFDIERNHQTVGYHYDLARTVAGVTVTTPYLADLYKEQGVEEVYIFPNSVDTKGYIWPEVNRPDDKIRVLWEGSPTHVGSWLKIRHAFVDWVKRNPNVKFVVFGMEFPWMPNEIPPDQYEHHPWVEYSAYQITRSCIGADINFCPLDNHPFNVCKSAIRWYEGSIGPRPEASIAAKVGPYTEIQDGETGMLYDTPEEMCEKLDAMVASAELRKQLAENAQKWVLDNRHVDKTTPGLLEFYKHLKTKQRQEALAA